MQICFLTKTLKIELIMKKNFKINGPWKNYQENLRRVLRILTASVGFILKWAFPQSLSELCMWLSLSLSSFPVRTASTLVIKPESERGNPSNWTLNLHPSLWLVKGEKCWGGMSTPGWEGGEEVRSAPIYSDFRQFQTWTTLVEHGSWVC